MSKLNIGAKIWCWICLAANIALMTFASAALATANSKEEAVFVIQMIVGFVTMTGYIILLCGRKEGFCITCAIAIVFIIVGIILQNFSALFIIALNPLITWFIIRPSWKNLNLMPQKTKSRTVALIIACNPITGFLGIERFYLGYVWTGFLKFFTCGGCLIWCIIDIVHIINGKMKDKWGRSLER